MKETKHIIGEGSWEWHIQAPKWAVGENAQSEFERYGGCQQASVAATQTWDAFGSNLETMWSANWIHSQRPEELFLGWSQLPYNYLHSLHDFKIANTPTCHM